MVLLSPSLIIHVIIVLSIVLNVDIFHITMWLLVCNIVTACARLVGVVGVMWAYILPSSLELDQVVHLGS